MMHKRYMVGDGLVYQLGPMSVDQYPSGTIILLREDQLAAHRQQWKVIPCPWVKVICTCGASWHTRSLQPEAEACQLCGMAGTHTITPTPAYLPPGAVTAQIQPPAAAIHTETGPIRPPVGEPSLLKPHKRGKR